MFFFSKPPQFSPQVSRDIALVVLVLGDKNTDIWQGLKELEEFKEDVVELLLREDQVHRHPVDVKRHAVPLEDGVVLAVEVSAPHVDVSVEVPDRLSWSDSARTSLMVCE